MSVKHNLIIITNEDQIQDNNSIFAGVDWSKIGNIMLHDYSSHMTWHISSEEEENDQDKH